MSICFLCSEQAIQGKLNGPHALLIPRGESRKYPGFVISEYIEQDYECRKCGTILTYNNCDNGIAWRIKLITTLNNNGNPDP